MSLITRLRSALGFEGKAAVAEPVNAAAPPGVSSTLFQILLGAEGGGEITPHNAWKLYVQVGALARVVDIIADQVAQIVPLVEASDGEMIEEHAALDLLRRPGYNRTRRGLVKELVVQFLVTGTGALHLIGNVKRPPLAIDLFQTRHLNFTEDTDGWPLEVQVNEARRGFQFRREGLTELRYMTPDMMSELMTFVDVSGEQKGVGLSRLSAVRNDVELKLKGLVHNRALIENGASPSAIVSFANPLSADQDARVRADLAEMRGPRNAGRVAIASGGNFDLKLLGLTPKDMDWSRLMEIVDETIADRYGVPQAIYSTKAQTYDNYRLAWRAFYDTAALPTWQIVYQALGRVMSARMGEEIKFAHDPMAIEVLAQQAVERAVKLQKSSLATLDECREIVGLPAIEGGDVIYAPSGLAPLTDDGSALDMLNEQLGFTDGRGSVTGEGDGDAADAQDGAGDGADDDGAGNPDRKTALRAIPGGLDKAGSRPLH